MQRAAKILERIQARFRERPSLEVGERIYRLDPEPIARGGMGLVYAVEVIQNTAFRFQVYDRKRRLFQVEERLERAVLKIPFADQDFARRAIKTEKEALQRPAHPNVVRLLERIPIEVAGQTYDGLVLERLTPSPAELLSDGPLESRPGIDAATAIEMVANLLKALNTIHYHKRIYLCDIKPLNILLRLGAGVGEGGEYDPRGEYVCRLSNGELQWAFIDLGIAVPREAVNNKTKNFIGSTEYSPPEAVVDFFLSERRDVYSLVATFAEMLTGKKPYLPALLEARKRYREAVDAADEAERPRLRARRGRMTFDEIRKEMRAGVAPYNIPDIIEQFRGLPECSELETPTLDALCGALEAFFIEGLHPDPAKRATPDRLFHLLRGPFDINPRATSSFLDDYFALRFRQGVLPRPSEVVSPADDAPYRYRGLDQKAFGGFFVSGGYREDWSQPASADDPGTAEFNDSEFQNTAFTDGVPANEEFMSFALEAGGEAVDERPKFVQTGGVFDRVPGGGDTPMFGTPLRAEAASEPEPATASDPGPGSGSYPLPGSNQAPRPGRPATGTRRLPGRPPPPTRRTGRPSERQRPPSEVQRRPPRGRPGGRPSTRMDPRPTPPAGEAPRPPMRRPPSQRFQGDTLRKPPTRRLQRPGRPSPPADDGE